MKILTIFLSSIFNYSALREVLLTPLPSTLSHFPLQALRDGMPSTKPSSLSPNTEDQWAKILMVQTLKCDSLTAGDKYACGEWDYIWSTFVDVPQG